MSLVSPKRTLEQNFQADSRCLSELAGAAGKLTASLGLDGHLQGCRRISTRHREQISDAKTERERGALASLAAPPTQSFATTSTTNDPGFIFPRRSPGAGGSKSAAGRKILCDFRSSPIVRADFFVATVAATEYLSGPSSCATVKLPSPVEANARFVSGSKPLASTPSPIGTDATTFPLSALITAIILLSQPAKRRRDFKSPASPDGSWHGAIGHRFSTFRSLESK